MRAEGFQREFAAKQTWTPLFQAQRYNSLTERIARRHTPREVRLFRVYRQLTRSHVHWHVHKTSSSEEENKGDTSETRTRDLMVTSRARFVEHICYQKRRYQFQIWACNLECPHMSPPPPPPPRESVTASPVKGDVLFLSFLIHMHMECPNLTGVRGPKKRITLNTRGCTILHIEL